ncbi:hypothetical protein AeMF1_014425, partial [Aphanomyces euteiches]
MRWSAATSIAAALILLVKQGHAAQCSTIEEDTDYYNNDIKSTQQTSADKCCDDCAKTTGCTVYVWNNFTQTCWLKSQPSNKATSPGARASRLVLTPATCSAVQKNVDLPGNDIGDPILADTYALCCTYCSVTKGCVAYAWSPADAYGPATCYLKSSKGKATSYKGSMAAYLTTPTTAPTTKAPTTAAPTTTKATTAAPTTTKATTAAPTTTAPTTTKATTVAPTTTAATTAAPTTTAATTAAPTSTVATTAAPTTTTATTAAPTTTVATTAAPTTTVATTAAPTTTAPTTTAATTAAPTTTASPTTTAATTAAPTTTAATTAAPTTTAATTAAPTTTAATTAAPTTTASPTTTAATTAAPTTTLATTVAPTTTAATTAAPTTTASPTTTATTTAAPTTTAATTAAPTTTTATTAAPTTAAPTPSPTTATQCAAVQPNTDYYGNDMVTLQKDTIDACCAACISTPGCVVFVWVMRDVGTCLLKSGFGTPSTYTGAYASYPVVPTPAPTPSACPVVENDVDYPGNDINQTSRTNYLDCCTDCQGTPGCSLYLWSSGVCYLKSKKGTSNYYAGTKAGVLPVATPTTAAPTTTAPTTTQCAAVQPNTDYYGYDIVTLQKDTIDQCCAACISTPGCVVFVWVMRDVGTCILKSGFGTPSTFTGAYASYPIVPTPAPTPSACPVVENDVDYPGNDIYQTSRANYLDCCTDCQATPGCSLYLWSSGVCYLKSKKETSKYYAGTKAGVLPVAAPTTALANLQFGVHGTFPLASLSYGYIPGSMWIPQTTLPVVTSQVESFIERNKAANNSHDSSPVPMFTLEADLGLIVYINVTSKGECAALTGAYANSFFTYLPSHLYCLMHQNTADTTLQVFTAPGQTMVFPQSLDDAYMSGSQANVATNALCLSACATKNNCVGVVYTASTQLCTFYQPKVSTFSDVSAGWVNPAAYYVDNGSIQYTKMPMASLPKAYVSSTMPSVTSADACATYANTKSSILFGYNSNTLSCVVYTPTSSTTKSLSFFNTPSAPVVLSGAFGSDVSGGSLTASTSLDCYKLCLPSQNNCFASVFDSTA